MEQYLVILDVVQLEDNETLVQQIKLPVGIEQKIIFAATIVRLKHVQEIEHVEILLAGAFLLQYLLILVTDKLIESIERGHD